METYYTNLYVSLTCKHCKTEQRTVIGEIRNSTRLITLTCVSCHEKFSYEIKLKTALEIN